jgi:hypothetical protein
VRYVLEGDGVRVSVVITLPPLLKPVGERVLRAVAAEVLKDGMDDSLAAYVVKRHAALLADTREILKADPSAASATGWLEDTTVTSVWNGARLLCLQLSRHDFTGGAHPNSEQKTLLLSFPDARCLTLDELIPKASEGLYAAAIERALREGRYTTGIKNEPPIPGFGEYPFSFPFDPQSAIRMPQITANGLTIFYPPYAMAPYCDGEIKVELPRDEATPFLHFNPWTQAAPVDFDHEDSEIPPIPPKGTATLDSHQAGAQTTVACG